MSDFRISSHAEMRMSQRGMRESDIELLLQYGTQIDDSVFFLSQKVADREIRLRKLEIQKIERLRNHKVVTRGGTIITSYPCSIGNQKATLRRAKEYA